MTVGRGVMKKLKSRKIITAISLQGGGARGAYEYGVLKAIYMHRGPAFKPRVVAGVSIGAINAALLVGARGNPLEALDMIWRERFCVTSPFASLFPCAGFLKGKEKPMACADLVGPGMSWLGNPGMYSLKTEFICMPFFAPLLSSSFYDTSLLKKTLTEFIDPEKLNRPEKIRLIVTAVNVRTGRQERFDNAKMKITIDHIIASGSFPVSFPMTFIEGNGYWDGGIFMNMPVGVAVNALEQIEADNPDVEREIILVSLHRMEGQLPATLSEASERFYNLVFSGKFALDKKLYEKYGAFVDVMQEIDKTLPADSPIRNHKGYRDLVSHRKIDRIIIIGEEGKGAVGSGSDFSRKTLIARIDDGFKDAMVFFKKSAR